jgi:putative hydrolase of the HAD superfamily
MILVLDLDGVVLTGHAEGGRWDKYLERDLGIASSALQEKFFKRYWRAIMLGRLDMFEGLRSCWPSLDCRTSPDEFVKYWFANDCTIDAAVLDTVREWRSHTGRCVLATNQEHYRARYLWNERGLSEHFDAMHYSAELGAEKPEVEFFRLVHVRLGTGTANDVFFLDDAPANVIAAAQFGWRAQRYKTVVDLKGAIATARDSPAL